MHSRFLFVLAAFLALVGTGQCSSVFSVSDPLVSSPQRSTVAFEWTKINGATVYNVEWDYYGSFEYLLVTEYTHAEFAFAPPDVEINYRVSTRVAGVLVQSLPQTFTLEGVTIDTDAAVDSVPPPSAVQIDSSKVFITWAAFNLGAAPEYIVEQFIDGDWEPIASFQANDTSEFEDRTVTVSVKPGLPHFYRVTREAISSPSFVFTTTAEDSAHGFTSPFSSLNIQTIPASEATFVNNTVTIPLGNVDEFVLGESGGARGLVRYDLTEVGSLNLCNFLYARLVFDLAGSSLPTISNTEADGSSIRTYGSLTSSWNEATVTTVTAPKPTDPSLYLSDTQVVQFMETPGGGMTGEPIVFVPLDRTLTDDGDNIVSLLNSWRENYSSNNGLLLTATNSLTAKLTLPVPDLEIVSKLDLSDRTNSAVTVIDYNVVTDMDECVISSTCNNDGSWMEGIRQLPAGLVPPGAVVVSMTATLNGGVNSLDIDRLTVSVSGAAIGDQFLSGDTLNCAAAPQQIVALTSPEYPPQAGGWPNFDTAATENNEIKVVYEGTICLSNILLEVEYISMNGDPNCPSPTPSPSVTPTSSMTVTASPSSTVSLSSTRSVSRTPSTTVTASNTPTPSTTPTRTATPSGTRTRTPTSTQSHSSTSSVSSTASLSPGASASNTPTSTRSPSGTPSMTATQTPSNTQTPSSSQTGTGTPTPSETSTPSMTASSSTSSTPSITPSNTPTPSTTRTASATRTRTASNTPARTPSRTPTPSASSTRSASGTPSQSNSNSPTRTPTRTPSNTPTGTPSIIGIPSASSSPTVTPVVVLPSSKPSASVTPSVSALGPDPSPAPDPSTAPGPSPSAQVSPIPSASRSPSRTSLPSVNSAFICAANPSFCEDNEEVEVDVIGSGGGTFVLPDQSGAGGAFVSIPPDTFPDGSVVVVSIPQNVPETDQELSSTVVDITVFNVAGAEIEPIESVEICLESTSDDADQCLGFLDFSEDPPEWKCEDKCPTKRGRTFCGETTHFTNFALLLGSVGADECRSDASEELIFDAAWKDGVLVASVAVGICFCCLVLLVLLLLVPGADRLVYGKEGMRVKTLRSNTSRLVDSVLDNTEVEELV